MNLQQIKIFIAIAEAKNITQASKQLFLSQPALSYQLSLLEKEVGCSLVVRSNRGIELTTSGEVLYLQAKKIEDELIHTVELVQEANMGVFGQLSIGYVYTTYPCFSSQLASLRVKYPNIRISLEPDLPHNLVSNLEKGHIDVAFLRMPMSDTNTFSSFAINNEASVLVMHEKMDPRPNSDTVFLEDLRDIPFCAGINLNRFQKSWDYTALLQDSCRKIGFELQIIFHCNGAISRLMLACSGLAACVVPEKIVDTFSCTHLHKKKIEGYISSTQPVMLWNSNLHISRPLSVFLDHFLYEQS